MPTDAYSLDAGDRRRVPGAAQGDVGAAQVPARGHQVRRPVRGREGGLGTKFDDEETGELPDEVDAAALNKWLFNEDTVDKVLEHLMTGRPQGGGRRPARQDDHLRQEPEARRVHRRSGSTPTIPHSTGNFGRVIDNYVKYAQSLIDDFSIKEKAPHIAISVDMLDTGIDVPEVVNLVFFKLVRSKTKFWQMLGRGTRLCPDLFGPGEDKEVFYIFDFCQNLEFFGERPEGYDAPLQDSVKTKIFKRRLEVADHLARKSREWLRRSQ